MRHGSLFSGIGGFDLAAEWMGWENVFHCEWNPFGQKILNHYWPDAELFTDITKSNFTKYANKIDILTGGFPCQPYSISGKRLGKDDERHLWPHMLRAIQEIKPTYVVGENVRGLINWNGGVVFEEVCVDLENCGYEIQPILLPACAIGAPHRRERIWFVAYAKSYGCEQRGQGIDKRNECQSRNGTSLRNNITTNGKKSNASDTDCNGLNECQSKYEIDSNKRRFNALDDTAINDGKRDATDTDSNGKRQPRTDWQKFPTQSPICGGDDGFPPELDGITFSKWRQESIRGYGNAIVPQIVFEIFKAIEAYEERTNH